MHERVERGKPTSRNTRNGTYGGLQIAALAGFFSGAVAACSPPQAHDTKVNISRKASALTTPADKPVPFSGAVNNIRINGSAYAGEPHLRQVKDFNGNPITKPATRIDMVFDAIDPNGNGDIHTALLKATDFMGGVGLSVAGTSDTVPGLSDPKKSEDEAIIEAGFGGRRGHTIGLGSGIGGLTEDDVIKWVCNAGSPVYINSSTLPDKLKVTSNMDPAGSGNRVIYDKVWIVDTTHPDWCNGLLADIKAALNDVKNPGKTNIEKLKIAGLLDPTTIDDQGGEGPAPETNDGFGSVFKPKTVWNTPKNTTQTNYFAGAKGDTGLYYDAIARTWSPAAKQMQAPTSMFGGIAEAVQLLKTPSGRSVILIVFRETSQQTGEEILTFSVVEPKGNDTYAEVARWALPDSAAPDDDNDSQTNQAENAVGGAPGLADDGWRDKNGLPVVVGFKDCGPQQMDPNGDMVQDCTSLVQTANAVYQNARVHLKDGTAFHTTGNNMPPAIAKDRTIVARPDWILGVHPSPDGKAPTPSFKIRYPMGDTPHAFPYSTDLLDGTAAMAPFKYQKWGDMPNAPFFIDQIPSMNADALAKYPPSPGDDELGLLGSTVEFRSGGEGLQPNWQKDMGADAGPDMSMPKDGGADLVQNPDMAENPDLARMMPQMDLSVAPDLTNLPDMAVAPDLASLPPDLRQMMSDLAADPVNDMISPPAVDAGQSPDADTDGAAGDSENNNGGGGCGCKLGGQHNHGKDGTPVPAELGAALLALGALRKRRSLAGLVQRARSGVARALGLAA